MTSNLIVFMRFTTPRTAPYWVGQRTRSQSAVTYRQCAGGPGAQAVRTGACRSTPHLARDCYERDLGRQPYAGRFVGEPHRCRTRPRCRHPHFFLGLLPRRNSDHNRDSCDWRMVAKLNFWVHSFRPQWIHRQSLTSACGPSRKSHDVRFLVAIGVKADLSRASNFVGYYARDSEWSARIKKTPHQNSKSLARFSV